jgi:hypothetical protein
LEKSIDKNDPLYITYKEREVDTAKRFPKRIMESDTFKDLIEAKDLLLEDAKNCTKVQLMCFSDDGIFDQSVDSLTSE